MAPINTQMAMTGGTVTAVVARAGGTAMSWLVPGRQQR